MASINNTYLKSLSITIFAKRVDRWGSNGFETSFCLILKSNDEVEHCLISQLTFTCSMLTIETLEKSKTKICSKLTKKH